MFELDVKISKYPCKWCWVTCKHRDDDTGLIERHDAAPVLSLPRVTRPHVLTRVIEKPRREKSTAGALSSSFRRSH